jgi:hypothetical protein
MAAKPRKSAVQNIVKNLLQLEIPEIQNASKELAEWIKQLEQHSFKLQHYATEIESWAAEEEEADTIELTDLIKDLEATLSDMRTGRAIAGPSLPETEESQISQDRFGRDYGRSGRVLRDSRGIPRAEIKGAEEKIAVKQIEPAPKSEEEITEEPAKTPRGVLGARDSVKPRAKSELPTGGKQLVVPGKAPHGEEETRGGYMTPEGFLIRKLRP